MAKKAKKHEEEEGAGEAWLLPYSDLMTLLLAVFIVLFAVSQVDQVKLDAMANAFGSMLTNSGSDLLPGGPGLNPGGAPFDVPPNWPELIPLQPQDNSPDDEGDGGNQQEVNDLLALQEKLNGYFEEAGVEADVTTVIDERGLVVSLQSTVLFDSGKAVLKPENRDLLIQMGKALTNIDNYIRIEGHTDNVPMYATQYPRNNQELSTARATILYYLFVDFCEIKPEKLITVGYSEYRPVADNNTADGRAKNRRVDLVVLSSRYNVLETADAQQN